MLSVNFNSYFQSDLGTESICGSKLLSPFQWQTHSTTSVHGLMCGIFNFTEVLRCQMSVPTLKFVLFLYIQQLHKISLRASLVSGSDEYPLKYSTIMVPLFLLMIVLFCKCNSFLFLTEITDLSTVGIQTLISEDLVKFKQDNNLIKFLNQLRLVFMKHLI